jgi:hypothetical protein
MQQKRNLVRLKIFYLEKLIYVSNVTENLIKFDVYIDSWKYLMHTFLK